MLTLQADNRQLLQNAKYSYLNDNYLSGVSSIVVTNSNGFADADYILLGNFGSETAEIVKINTVTAATHTLSLTTATKFSHSESTKITVLKYNQVRFYRTTTATFSAGSPLGTEDIQADDYNTKYYDLTNTTGFGWFVFLNSTTLKATQNSNAIPYAGFNAYSVKTILDDFFSLINNKNSSLITLDDAFSWLNEAYSKAQNALNLVNESYKVADSYDLTVASGQAEYTMPSSLSTIISIYDTSANEYLKRAGIEDIDEDNDDSTQTKYYTRSGYIGFTPIPTEGKTYTVRYKAKTTQLNSYYDNIDLPDNSFYLLKDYMMYRAAPKLEDPNPERFLAAFNAGIQEMKVTSHRQESAQDSWEIDPRANV